MAVKITEYYFEFGGVKYFRENAHNVEMGSYGEKKDPLGPKAHLDVQNKVNSEYLESRVKYNTETNINWNETTKAEVEAEGILKFFSLGKEGTVNATYEEAKEARLDLVNFAIDEGPLQAMLNKEANAARNYLADCGNDGRIVSEVWIVVDAELGEHFATYGSSSAAVHAAGSSLSITVSGGKHGAQTVTLSKGTTFAYKLHKVKDWNKGKTQIEDLEADYKGGSEGEDAGLRAYKHRQTR
jgi:hypothetical protein